MKRTTRHPVRTFLLQILRIRLYYPDNVRPVFQIVDEVLRVEHAIFAFVGLARIVHRVHRESAYDNTASDLKPRRTPEASFDIESLD